MGGAPGGGLPGASNKPPGPTGGDGEMLFAPMARRPWSRARWCRDSAVEIWSLVSISVRRVSSSGAGELEWM